MMRDLLQVEGVALIPLAVLVRLRLGLVVRSGTLLAVGPRVVAGDEQLLRLTRLSVGLTGPARRFGLGLGGLEFGVE